jgi:hypothetical protein
MTFELLRNVSDDDVRQRYERQGAKRVRLRPGTQATNDSTLICRSVEPQTFDPDDGDAYYLAVSHVSAQEADGGDQRYALAVELVEHERLDIDLYAAVQAHARVRARVRLRG